MKDCSNVSITMIIHITSAISAHYLWIFAVLGGQGSNGWYKPIILTSRILFINLSSQNNHKITITNIEVFESLHYEK